MAKSILARLLPSAAKSPRALRSHDPELEKRCPNLAELLTATLDDAGKPRQPCSLVLFAEDGVFKGCLSEKDLGLNLWASSDSLVGVLGALEDRLTCDVIEWRAKPGVARKAK